METTDEQVTMNPIEKIRNRLAAEGYNRMDEEKGPEDADSDYKNKNRGWTSTEKHLVAVVIICIIFIIVLGALLVVQNIMGFHKKTCHTPECVEVAGSVLKKMDTRIKPCDDFYHYSCGSWLASLTPPPDKAKYSMFAEVEDRNKARLRKLMSEPSNELNGQDSSAVQKAKHYFKACMDTQATEDRGTTPLLQVIKDLGSWTVTSDEVSGTWVEDRWDRQSVLAKVISRSSAVLFMVGIGADMRNVSSNIIQFDQGGLTFADRSFYLDDVAVKYHKAFIDYFSAVTVLLGSDNVTAHNVAEDIWEFEKRLANITTPEDERQDQEKLYKKKTLQDLQDIMGNWIDLEEFLKQMMGIHIPLSTDIVTYADDYLAQIGALVNSTSVSTLANYFVWHGMSGGLAYMPYSFRQAKLQLHHTLQGVTDLGAQWEICIDRVMGVLGQAIGAIFVEKFFSEEDKNSAVEMLKMIKKEFETQLPLVAWMDEETKKRALDKVAAIEDKVGYPPMAKDAKRLDEHYELMKISSTDAFQNWLDVTQFYVKKNIDKLGKVPDRTEWHMSPATVNAYYNPTNNEMVFPAAILQRPFYDPSYSMAQNFGAIGMVMGHELTHGFDNTGRQFDKKGNLHNWWNDVSSTAFIERTKCMIDQYNNFEVGTKHVNGKLTLGENIADNGGLKTALGAYKAWLRSHGNSERRALLPALNMTETQVFFMGFSQIWCTYYTPEYARQAIATDVHSPSWARVLGTLQNMEAFSDVFSCSQSSKMNPDTKCDVW